MQFSFWEKTSFIKSPDVVIIGSGIVGLNAALDLKKNAPHLHVLVLEKGMLPYGASTRNAGFACFGSPSELLNDILKYSEDAVFELVEKRWRGLQRLREILGDNAIEYETLGGHEIFAPSDNMLFEQCRDSLPHFNQRLFSITGQKEMYRLDNKLIEKFGFKNIKEIILNSGEGQIDTGKMMKALLDKTRNEGVEILNGVSVSRIEENENSVTIHLDNPTTITSENQSVIKSKCVLICVNGFAKKFLPNEDIVPARAQVLITSPIDTLRVKGTFQYDQGFYYFRNVGNRLLLGGGRNINFENENTESFGLTSDIQSRLEEMLKNTILPSEKYSIEMRWSGIMGLGSMKSPIIKKTGMNSYCAVRMGGMGIAIGSLVGEEAATLVLKNL